VEDKQLIADSGRTEIIELTDDERAQWVEVMKPVWGKFEEEIGPELIEAAYESNEAAPDTTALAELPLTWDGASLRGVRALAARCRFDHWQPRRSDAARLGCSAG
jgi:hypothetical protein